MTAESDYLTVTYYDDYDWLPANSPHAFSTTDALGNTANYRIQGQTTGGKSKVLGIDTDRWLTMAAYFDSDYQAIQSVADLYPSGVEITSNTHDFTGNVTQTKVKQIVNNTVYEYNKWFEFDNFGRLQQVSQQITGDEVNGKVILASYTYDELGHTATKSIHNGLETESYGHDLQGRTIQSLSPSFSWWLGFDQTVAKMTGRYDGNIQAAVWQHAGETKKAYRYTYDDWGQMTSGIYRSMDNGNSWSVKNSFKESVAYEKNGTGNINWISRTDASGVSTSITLGFTGYQVKDCQLSGQSRTTFIYDTEGNLIYDGRSGVDIEYNCLNLPEKVSKDSHNIHYIYDASGQKLACDANGSLTYYRSVMVYGHDNKLLYMLHPEGTVSRTEGSAGTSYTYNYFKTDHLGSTRVMLTAVDGVLQASQTTDYYPFGLSFENNNLNKNKYLFSGKEFQDGQLGGSILGWYDFGARFYDPVLGRWFNVDPVARFANPYLYCVNNPVMSIDPDGRNPVVIIVALLVAGGTINVVANWDNIENFWQGLGFFATGAGSAALAIWGGPAGLIGGGFLNGSGNAALSGADGADVLKQGIISAGVAGASAPVGYAFSKASNWTFNGLKNGSLLKQIAVQTTTGYATGVSMAYLVQGISTGEWGEETWSYAANAGWKSAVNANITGLGFRFYKSQKNDLNFWTLKPNTILDNGVSPSVQNSITNNTSTHAVQRMSERTITQDQISQALSDPLKVTNVRIDAQGRPSQQYIGRDATVVINPETGKIITTWPTKTKTVNKLTR